MKLPWVQKVFVICVAIIINVEGYVLHSSVPLQTHRLSSTLLNSSPDKLHEQRQLQLLCTVPKNSSSKISSYFSNWLVAQTDWMSTIDSHVSSEGLRFAFRASPGSYLQVSIGNTIKNKTENKEYLDVTVELCIQSKEEKVKTLISFAADNIINSLTQGLAELSDTLLSTRDDETVTGDSSVSNNYALAKDDGPILKAWDVIEFMGINSRHDMLTFLYEWSTKFVGVGIEATHQSDGVSFSFLVAPAYQLRLRISPEFYNNVYPELVIDTHLTVEGSSVEHRTLIEKATNGIVKDLTSSVVNRTTGGRNTVKQKASSSSSSSSRNNSKTASFVDDISSRAVTPTAASTKSVNHQNTNANIPAIPNDDIGSIYESTKAVTAAKVEVVTADSYVKSLKRANPSVTTTNQSKNSNIVGSTSQQQQQSPWQPYLDPSLKERAQDAGVRLEKFANSDLSEQSLNELNKMLDETKKQGIFSHFESLSKEPIIVSVNERDNNSNDNNNGGKQSGVTKTTQPTTKAMSLNELFDVGSSEILSGKAATTSLSSVSAINNGVVSNSGKSPTTSTSTTSLSKSIQPTPLPISASTVQDEKRLMLLMNELNKSLPERHDDIILAFEDLLLSDNILALLKTKSEEALSMDIRLLYGKITTKAAEMWNTYANLVAEESVRHLETVLDVCQVSRDFQHDPLVFADEMDLIKPKFDTTLLSYLRHAIKEEETAICVKGIDPTTIPSTWLQVLLIVRNGVAYELEARFQRVIEPLIFILRFDQVELRSQLFSRLIQSTPTLDLPYLRTCAENMVDYTLTNQLEVDPVLCDKMKFLVNDIEKYLSDEILQYRIDEFKKEAKQQGSELIVTSRSQRYGSEKDSDDGGGSHTSSARKKWIGSSIIDTAGDVNDT